MNFEQKATILGLGDELKDTIFVLATDAHVEHQTDAKVIGIKRFEKGFWPMEHREPEELEELNRGEVPPEVITSAVSASMFGWGAKISRAAHDWFATRDQQEFQRSLLHNEARLLLVIKELLAPEQMDFKIPRLGGMTARQVYDETLAGVRPIRRP